MNVNSLIIKKKEWIYQKLEENKICGEKLINKSKKKFVFEN